MDEKLVKANLTKRAIAWLLDTILLVLVSVSLYSIVLEVTDYDDYAVQLENYYAQYEQMYDTSFDISEEEFYEMTNQEMENYEAAYNALMADENAMALYSKMIWMMLAMLGISSLLGYAALEFVIPMLLGRGQTVGKKIFSLSVVKVDGEDLGAVGLLLRTFVGKFLIETMFPVMMVVLMMFGFVGLVGPVLVLVLVVLEIVVMVRTESNSMVHDLLANSVTVERMDR